MKLALEDISFYRQHLRWADINSSIKVGQSQLLLTEENEVETAHIKKYISDSFEIERNMIKLSHKRNVEDFPSKIWGNQFTGTP